MRSTIIVILAAVLSAAAAAEEFEGRYYAGEGDVSYLQLLDISARMFQPDPEFQNISMLYSPDWDGFVEGPTWGAWWIQNSYGPSYCALPFFEEPYVRWLQNAQNLWFSQMGDGVRKGAKDWVAPDGCLCDAASPGWIYYKQGDGKIDIHDWGMEFTAAGIVLQSELLLIGRDLDAVNHYLPMLERSANFIETRRDPQNNLFLAGAAGNLLAPSYAGWKKPDGTYGMAYLAGLSVTYIAGLDRLIELEKMAGNADKARLDTQRRDLARQGLAALTTDEGYFIKYMDPDGTRHGVYGAEKHGYFEAVCNHDAVAFRVVDDAQAGKIYDKIASIPGLRPYGLIITNCPGLDDMYEPPVSWLWKFGTWVNGGHWTTCEARMMMAYSRLGKHDDIRRAMEQMMKFARVFRMDNPMVDFGNEVYQPKQPINCVYDNWGAPAGMIRGLFEYLYTADGLTLLPHVPAGITALEQRFPVRFGAKRLYISTAGAGPVTAVNINGAAWGKFDAGSVTLPDAATPDEARIAIGLGGTAPPPEPQVRDDRRDRRLKQVADAAFWDTGDLGKRAEANTLPLRIGADSDGGTRFIGDIDAVRIYRKSLTDEQLAALAANRDAEPPEKDALVAEWTFDGEANAVFNSAVGGFVAKPVGKVEAIRGDKALRLDGDGQLEVAHDERLALEDEFTIAAWVRPKKMEASGGRIIDKCTAGKDDGYLLDTCPGNSLRVITPRAAVSFDAKLPPGQWAHVAATFVGGRLRLCLDGKEVATAHAKPMSPKVDLPRAGRFYAGLCEKGLGDSVEAKQAGLVIDYYDAVHARMALLKSGALPQLPEVSQKAADESYIDAAARIAEGLRRVLESQTAGSLKSIWEKSAP